MLIARKWFILKSLLRRCASSPIKGICKADVRSSSDLPKATGSCYQWLPHKTQTRLCPLTSTYCSWCGWYSVVYRQGPALSVLHTCLLLCLREEAVCGGRQVCKGLGTRQMYMCTSALPFLTVLAWQVKKLFQVTTPSSETLRWFSFLLLPFWLTFPRRSSLQTLSMS